MSTELIIARPVPGHPDQWRGTVVNADGYPTAGGKHLYAQIVTHYQGRLDEARDYFVDRHPAGWRSIEEALGANECYCHDLGEGTSSATLVTEKHAAAYDWTAVIRTDGMEVLRWGRHIVTVPWDAARVHWDHIEEHEAHNCRYDRRDPGCDPMFSLAADAPVADAPASSSS